MRYFLSLLCIVCLYLLPLQANFTLGGPVSPDGTEAVSCDYPADQCEKNRGGTDGSGLCVFYSITFSARWQNEGKLVNFNKDMAKEPGGGWPEKVDKMIAKYGRGAKYLQYQGKDLGILKAALNSGRMPAVTYSGRDKVLYSGSIAHMVCLVHLSDKWAAIRDNNYIGPNQILWMSPGDFQSRWISGANGWAVVLLNPGPPPVPTLRQKREHLPAPVQGAADPNPAPGRYYYWTPANNWLCLWHGTEQNSTQLGCWQPTKGYIAGSQDNWGVIRPHAPVDNQEKKVPDYGVCSWYLDDGEHFTLGDQRISRQEALEQLPPDGPRLTLIGQCSRLAVPDTAVVQRYENVEHWHLKGLGFLPGAWLQRPLGQVLAYQAKPDELWVNTALRRADPTFDPKKLPNDVSSTNFLPVALLAAGGLTLVLYWRRRSA